MMYRLVLAIAAGASCSVFGQASQPVQVLHATGAASDAFGTAAAIDEVTLVAESDNFGRGTPVSNTGGTIIVGACADGIGAASDRGSAYVFVRSGSTRAQHTKITAADGNAMQIFGSLATRHINTGRSKTHGRTLVNNGTVDSPVNLIRIAFPCPADLNGDDHVDHSNFQVFIIACTELLCP